MSDDLQPGKGKGRGTLRTKQMKTIGEGQVDVIHHLIRGRRRGRRRRARLTARGGIGRVGAARRAARTGRRLLEEIEKNALIGQGMELIALLFVIPIAKGSENAQDTVDQMDPSTVIAVVRGVGGQEIEEATERIDALMASRILRLLIQRGTDRWTLSNDIVDTVHTQLNGRSKELGDGVIRTEDALIIHLIEHFLKGLLLIDSAGLGHGQCHPIAENVFGLVDDRRCFDVVDGLQIFQSVANHRERHDRQFVDLRLVALRAAPGRRESRGGVVQSDDFQQIANGFGGLFADQRDSMERIQDRGDVTVDATGLFNDAIAKEVHREVQRGIVAGVDQMRDMTVDLSDVQQTIANQMIDGVDVEFQFIAAFQPGFGQLFVDDRDVQTDFDQQFQDVHVNGFEPFEVVTILNLSLNGVVLEKVGENDVQDVGQGHLRRVDRHLILKVISENVQTLQQTLQSVDKGLIVLTLNGLIDFGDQPIPDGWNTFIARHDLRLFFTIVRFEAGEEMDEVFVDRQLMRRQRAVLQSNRIGQTFVVRGITHR